MGAGKFLENERLLDAKFLLVKRGRKPPLDENGLPVEGYRYSFKGPAKQCRLCVHHTPGNVRINGGGGLSYRGAFRCAVKDFDSSSGYVVVIGCDRWRLREKAPLRNRGQAWLHMRPVDERDPSSSHGIEIHKVRR
jgi:hypothetical protein